MAELNKEQKIATSIINYSRSTSLTFVNARISHKLAGERNYMFQIQTFVHTLAWSRSTSTPFPAKKIAQMVSVFVYIEGENKVIPKRN
jgi:hypothetical protein